MPHGLDRKHQLLAGEVSFNMTPMIDCVFLLIIFFILAGQIASQSLAIVRLHEPHGSQAQKRDEKDRGRVVVNVPSMAGDIEDAEAFPFAGRADAYVIGGRRIEVGDVEILKRELIRLGEPYRKAGQKFFIEIRADKRVYFSEIEPVLWAAAEAKISKMYLTALVASNRGP